MAQSSNDKNQSRSRRTDHPSGNQPGGNTPGGNGGESPGTGTGTGPITYPARPDEGSHSNSSDRVPSAPRPGSTGNGRETPGRGTGKGPITYP